MLEIQTQINGKALDCFFNSYTYNKDYEKVKELLDGSDKILVRGCIKSDLIKYHVFPTLMKGITSLNGHSLDILVNGKVMRFDLADKPRWDINKRESISF